MAPRWKPHHCRAAVLPVSDGQLDDLNDALGHDERKCRGFADYQTFTFCAAQEERKINLLLKVSVTFIL
jgi:hypothetical protein